MLKNRKFCFQNISLQTAQKEWSG